MQQIVAANDPELANALTERILAGLPVGDEAPSHEPTPAPAPKMTPPPETLVELPCGIVTMDDGLIREAEVRELNGFDEEAIAKAGSPAKVVQALLERAVVRIGSSKPSKDTLSSLLTGDVDTLMIAIRRATYGDEIEYEFTCPHCQQEIEPKTHLVNDIKIKEFDEKNRNFTVELRKGEAKVHLPDWETQQKAANMITATEAEQATLILQRCVETINDMPVLGADTVRALSASDRKTLVKEIEKRVAGPQLDDVSTGCPACEEVLHLPISVASLFPIGG